jgi:6-phosphogluconolactonase
VSSGSGLVTLEEKAAGRPQNQNHTILVYVGTYTSGESKGIYNLELDLRTGELSEPELAAEVINPSFLAIHPSQSYLYSVNEISDYQGQKTGSVTAFRIELESGKLHMLDTISSGGTGPCYITTDRKGEFALVANYGGGSVSSIDIQPDGSLGRTISVIQHEGSSVDESRQKRPHAHSIQLDQTQKFALSADLGTDDLFVYRFNSEKGILTPHTIPSISLPPGSGPRHFSFHPVEPYIFILNELNSTVTVVQHSEFNSFKQLQEISTLPGRSEIKNYPAEILVHSSGKFLYASNRGHDSIACYKIHRDSGRIETIGFTPTGGKTPRNFAIDPTGRFLIAANQNSSNIVIFHIDQKTGTLTNSGNSAAIPSPVCIRFFNP